MSYFMSDVIGSKTFEAIESLAEKTHQKKLETMNDLGHLN